MPDVYNLKIFNARDASENFYQRWQDLLQKINGASFIQTPGWFKARIHAYPNDLNNVFFVTILLNNELCGVLPLHYETIHKFYLKLNIWQIYWPNDMGVNDFIIPTAVLHEGVFTKLFNILNQQNHLPWTLLQLQNVPGNSNLTQLINSSTPPLCTSVYQHESKYISCKKSYEESTAKISSKFKRNNRRKFKKLQKLGSIHFNMAYKKEDLEIAFEHFIEIEASNWKGKNNSAIKQNDKQYNFYKELLTLFGNTGECRIHSLWLNDEPIASQFAILIDDTYYMLKIGYNEKYKNVGPGGILLDETIKIFSGHKVVKKISFITGARWNDDWAPCKDQVNNYFIYNKNFLGYAGHIAERIKMMLRNLRHKFIPNDNESK